MAMEMSTALLKIKESHASAYSHMGHATGMFSFAVFNHFVKFIANLRLAKKEVVNLQL